MKRRLGILAAVAFLAVFQPGSAPGAVGLGVRVGTTGIGGEVAVPLVARYLNLRVAGSGGRIGLDMKQDDVTYDSDLTLYSWLALLDWHVGGGPFKIVVGAAYNGSEIEGTATPSRPIDLGDATFTPAQVGTLRAGVDYGRLGGYLGIGFGNLALDKGGRWTASLDCGLMVCGAPDLSLESRGGTLSRSAYLQRELKRELDEFEDDYGDWLRMYPVLTLGVSVRF